MNQPKVTFGFVNCNRLFYLKSCVESFLFCTEDYENKEVIVVDNASSEPGTDEYLSELESKGVIVHKTESRDPNNEYAKALNYIVENSTGDYVCPITGDMQFIIKGKWLEKYIEFYEKNKMHIGSMCLDAQRRVRIMDHLPLGVIDSSNLDHDDFVFYADFKRRPVAGNGNGIYSREILDIVYPWSVDNDGHESATHNDSENKMWKKVEELQSKKVLSDKIFHIVPQVPVAAGIYTDSRGTMARVRGNQRFGDYWEPKEDYKYYEVHNAEDILDIKNKNNGLPLSIEDLAKPIKWKAPLDINGNWMKNPIRPENASPEDFTDV